MNLAARRIAILIAGYTSFINLYSPQALLPSLAEEFGVGALAISATITAGSMAVALAAPFSGAIADVLGRKRVITAAMLMLSVPTALIALAPDVPTMVFWRFIQGLMLPPIFVVTIAYIGDEWPPAEIAGVAGLYTSGASFGGFSGRFVTGILADLIGWRSAFAVLAVMTLACACAVMVMLPRERHFVRSANLRTSLRQMLRHLRNPKLIATYAVGFGILFNFIATFTYITFVLADPPYNLSPAMLGMIFAVYLVGVVTASAVGWLVGRWGRRRFVLGVIAVWVVGMLLTLIPSLIAIIVGLIFCAGCGLMSQAVSTGYVAQTATEGRSSAVGLYVTFFYVGGGVGGFLPGLAYASYGWPSTVAMMIANLAIIAVIVAIFWKPPQSASAP